VWPIWPCNFHVSSATMHFRARRRCGMHTQYGRPRVRVLTTFPTSDRPSETRVGLAATNCTKNTPQTGCPRPNRGVDLQTRRVTKCVEAHLGYAF
jgi:hypothetical protein